MSAINVTLGLSPALSMVFELAAIAAYGVVAQYAWRAYARLRWPLPLVLPWVRRALVVVVVASLVVSQVRTYQALHAFQVGARRVYEHDWSKCDQHPPFYGADLQEDCAKAERGLKTTPWWEALRELVDHDVGAVVTTAADWATYAMTLAALLLAGEWAYAKLEMQGRHQVEDFLRALRETQRT